MLISAVPQCDPAILFHILFHCSLSLDIDYSSLCYTAGPHCEPTYLMISLSRLIICRQLCIDVLQLLHTQQVLNNVMIPWSTPQILGNSPKLHPPVFPVKMTLSTWAARTTILNLLLQLLTQHSLSYQTMPPLILWHISQALPPPTSDLYHLVTGYCFIQWSNFCVLSLVAFRSSWCLWCSSDSFWST